MKWAAVFIFMACLSGCQTAGQMAALRAEAEAEAASCKTLAGPTVGRAHCLNAAENKYVRPGYPYPDLLNLRHSSRVAIASRYDRKEITKEQADAEFDRVQAENQSEAVRRSTAIASVQAQQSAASSAAMVAFGMSMANVGSPPPAPSAFQPSIYCTTNRYGNYSTTNCN